MRTCPRTGTPFSASVAGLDADARALTGRPFWDLAAAEQMRLIDDVRTNQDSWHGMPGTKVFCPVDQVRL